MSWASSCWCTKSRRAEPVHAHAIPNRRWQEARTASLAVAHAFRADAPIGQVAAAFAGLAVTDVAVAQARATALLADPSWAGAMLAPLLEALAAEPLLEPPLKVNRGNGRTGAVLYDGPAARVTATVIAGGSGSLPVSAVASGQVVVTRYVRAGGLTLRHWSVGPVGDGFTAAGAPPARALAPVCPRDGDVVVHDGRDTAVATIPGSTPAVTLTAILRAGTGPLVREYGVADGGLLRCASTDEGASRIALMLALLRASDRRDAGELFAAATHAPVAHDRWTAMREWLALDADAAAERLGEMVADDPDADLRVTAAATLRLVEERRACRG